MKKTKLTLLLLVVAMLVLTLCACQQTYDVTFELGYDNKTEVKTYDKGAKVDFSPTRTDYDFGGWFKDEALTQPWGDSVVEADVTLYAKWTPKTTTQVTVTLDYNYHGAPSPKQETITGRLTLPKFLSAPTMTFWAGLPTPPSRLLRFPTERLSMRT